MQDQAVWERSWFLSPSHNTSCSKCSSFLETITCAASLASNPSRRCFVNYLTNTIWTRTWRNLDGRTLCPLCLKTRLQYSLEHARSSRQTNQTFFVLKKKESLCNHSTPTFLQSLVIELKHLHKVCQVQICLRILLGALGEERIDTVNTTRSLPKCQEDVDI